ncbi:hypothetical protein V6N11_045543 [Hibiscus sabdariffa]|uniref:RNase H type-1 domain-containing protein n=1 Tax=Hibiscus sabdariffa TaxID=183260 RepID=A0ABR2Q1Y0_9ROSI
MSHVSFGLVLTDNGEWDVAKLAMIFTEDALPYILGMCTACLGGSGSPMESHMETAGSTARIAHVSNRFGGILFRRLSHAFSSPHPSRNDAVFVGDLASVVCALSRGIAWAQYCYDGWLQPMPSVSPPLSTTPWSNPEPGCLCLNVDGAISLHTGKATIGGLLRDTAGNFIFGFSKFIGATNSLHAELWSLFVGLQLAWNHGVTFLQIQTDCKRVVELLHDPNVEFSPISLVRSIHQFWRRAWYVDLIWVPLSRNIAADSLARFADLSSFDLSFFSIPPARLSDVLATDTLALPL